MSDVTRRILSLISPVSTMGYKKIRVGTAQDGGYVILDNFVESSCCLSIGIGGDVSFDSDLADRGYDIFQYDHTVAGPPTTHERFKFFQVGLAPSDDAGRSLHTLDRMIDDSQIKRYQRPILKIDIEDAEWDILVSLDPSSLSMFDQICIEYHNLTRLSDAISARKIEGAFRVLASSHAPIHIHGNNWAEFGIINGIPIPDVVELTYASKKNYTFLQNNEIFPGPLDMPNKIDRHDYFLGHFQF